MAGTRRVAAAWILLALLIGSVAFGARSLAAPAEDPAAAPAATFTPTAVSVEPTPKPTLAPVEESPTPCLATLAADETPADEPIADLPPLDLGTPVAEVTPEATAAPEPAVAPCDTTMPTDPTPEPEPTLAPEPTEPAAEAGDLTDPTATPSIDEEASADAPPAVGETAVEDPALAGLELPTEPPADPALAGIPDEPIVAAEATDPMLTGLRQDAAVTVAALPENLAIARLSDVTALAGLPGPVLFENKNQKKAVTVETISADGEVSPGGSVTYQFRLENVGKGKATFDLQAVTDVLGWTAVVTVPPQYRRASGDVRLEEDEAAIVTVTVTAPTTATPGTMAVTTLDVTGLK